MALISARTGCRTASSAVHFASWINVQEVLPDAGSTTYKDMLAVLPPSAGAACLSAQ